MSATALKCRKPDAKDTPLEDQLNLRYPACFHFFRISLPNQVFKITVAMPGAADAFRNTNMPAPNLKYLLATILLDGRPDFVSAHFWERMLEDEAVEAVMSKVDIVEDLSQEATLGKPRRESA